MNNMLPHVRITIIYAVFGILWIFLSDRLLEIFISDAILLSQIQTFKGWLYVGLTTALLYTLIKSAYITIMYKEKEKKEIFNETVKAMHHILNNFLNNMVLFKIEANKSNDFRKEVLDLYEDVIKEAKLQIETLGTISDITKEEIQKSVYSKN